MKSTKRALLGLLTSVALCSSVRAEIVVGVSVSATGSGAALGPIRARDAAFAAYAFDAFTLLSVAAVDAKKKATPGTAEFRAALRDALENLREVVGTHAVYSMSPTDHNGVDQRSRVMVQVENGNWRLAR